MLKITEGLEVRCTQKYSNDIQKVTVGYVFR